MDIQCIYSVPLNATGTPPVEGEFWQYSQASCTIPYMTEYQSGTSTFYLSNTIDGGEVLIFTIVLVVFVAGIVKGLWNFFIR